MKIRCKIDVCAPRVFKLVDQRASDLRSSRPCSNARMGHIGVGFVAMSVPARSHLGWNHLPCRWMVWRKSWSDLKLGDWKTHLKENARFCVLAVGVRKHQWVLWIYVNKKCVYIYIYIPLLIHSTTIDIGPKISRWKPRITVSQRSFLLALASVHTLNKFQTNIRNKGLEKRPYSRTRRWLVTLYSALNYPG